MLNILFVDDEENIRNLFKIRLTTEGYNVIVSCNGEDALDTFYANSIDMVITDLMMPKMNGYELIQEIRKINQNVPIIMVSAKGEMSDKDFGYQSGVDDYLVKPIEFKELILKMKVLFRRAKIFDDNKITVGDVVIDESSLTIYNSNTGQKITLTKREFQILFKLLSYPERSFTKYQLFDEFWGMNSDTDESIIKVFISKIRKQIEPFKEIDIDTVVGIGYKGVKHE